MLLNMKTTLIRADADQLLTGPAPPTPENQIKAREIVVRANETINLLGHWIDSPIQRRHRFVVGIAPPLGARPIDDVQHYPGPVYAFRTVWRASKHLNANTSRVVLASIVIRCLTWLREANSQQFATAEHIAEDVALEAEIAEAMQIGRDEVTHIIASVPYFLSWAGDSDDILPPEDQDEISGKLRFPCGTADDPKGFAGISCLWPLLTTGLSMFATDEHRSFIHGRMKAMSNGMGIKAAESLAKV